MFYLSIYGSDNNFSFHFKQTRHRPFSQKYNHDGAVHTAKVKQTKM